MKSAKFAILALSMMVALGTATSAAAQSGYSGHEYSSSYFEQMRPMIAKLNAVDRKKAMDMEMTIMTMEANHQMAMVKATMAHKMVIMKMRQEYEDHVFAKGSF